MTCSFAFGPRAWLALVSTFPRVCYQQAETRVVANLGKFRSRSAWWKCGIRANWACCRQCQTTYSNPSAPASSDIIAALHCVRLSQHRSTGTGHRINSIPSRARSRMSSLAYRRRAFQRSRVAAFRPPDARHRRHSAPCAAIRLFIFSNQSVCHIS